MLKFEYLPYGQSRHSNDVVAYESCFASLLLLWPALLLAGWLALAMWTGLTGFDWLATVVLLAMKCIWFLSVPLWLL